MSPKKRRREVLECGGMFHALTASRHWISCAQFTVEVEVNAGGIITWAAPVVQKFLGQPLANLLRWAEGLGGLKHEVLSR
jgi:hypothetical protein